MSRPGIAWSVVILLVIGLLFLALQRNSFPAISGTGIHAPSSWKDSSNNRIRVSTYNIHRGKGLDGKKDISRIVDLVRSDDVTGLQEVRGPWFFGDENQAEYLGGALDTGWLFAPTQTRFNRIYTGNGLLSRIAVGSWEVTPLIWTESEQSLTSRRHRNRITARIIISGVPVTIINTHLDRGNVRTAQLHNLLAEFDRHERIILLGDLNTNPGSPEIINWLSKNPGTDVIAQSLGDADLPFRVDWILVRGLRLVSGGSEPAGPSDHPYFWAELELE